MLCNLEMENLKKLFESKPQIKLVYLFGSQVNKKTDNIK